MRKTLFKFALDLCVTSAVLVLIANQITAQTSRGAIAGTVHDPAGAVIAGAKVELLNQRQGVSRHTTTNEAGIYRFDAVELGTYDLKIAQPGFKEHTRLSVTVAANRTVTIDAVLAVGGSEATVEVSATTAEWLNKDAPLRGGNFSPDEISQLPLGTLNPYILARTLPGVVLPSGTATFGMAAASQVAVNGQRPRGNNYLLDGVENNDISITGPATTLNITDAVQEVAVQTSNYGAEFGRAGGGVFNLITKSGTNQYHGTAHWLFLSQVFDALTNTEKNLANIVREKNPPPGKTTMGVFTDNIYGFTLGGPIRRNKTFVFGAFQKDTYRSTGVFSFILPTAAAVSTLQTIFPGNPRLDLYLAALGDLRGSPTANARNIALGAANGVDRGSVVFGNANIVLSSPYDATQWLTKVDHNFSDRHSLTVRYLYDANSIMPTFIRFPGYLQGSRNRSQNLLLVDNFTINSTWTNELRFSYGRTGFDFPISPASVPAAKTLPQFSISSVSAPGIISSIPQFRYANNWLGQVTQSKVHGRHTFRYGAEFLRQLARQRSPFNERGSYLFTNATGYSAFVNFLEDFSGPSGSSARNFGPAVYYPNLFRHSYFAQDTWRASPALTLTLGLRYENFGQPANALPYPAFAGSDPSNFLVPNQVAPDNNNFAPSVGLAWSPAYESGLLGRVFGAGRGVIRAGFQISYDTFFNNLLSNIVADAPNSVSTSFIAPGAGRGAANFLATLPTVARTPTALDSQTAVFDPNIRNPYTERYSIGFQRSLPGRLLLDLAYVGSQSHKLFTNIDRNPRNLAGQRLFPALGVRRTRESVGNANYNALQARLERRFSRGLLVTSSYTFSRTIDSTSEVFTGVNSSSLLSVPLYEGLTVDRGVSDLHRKHRLVLTYLWQLPGPKRGVAGQAFGGWALSGITTFQAGAPFTVSNGFDRNNDGLGNDRPDIGHPGAPVNTRGVVESRCASGYRNGNVAVPNPFNPSVCVNSDQVRWLEGRGVPNARTVGRNTLFAQGVKIFDVSLFKTFRLTESPRLEFRCETFNLFNTRQFTAPPPASVTGSPAASATAPSQFLNPYFVNGGARGMRFQLKLLF